MPRAHVRPNTVSGSYALKKHKIGEILQKSAKNGPFWPVFSTFWHQKFTRGYQFLTPDFDPKFTPTPAWVKNPNFLLPPGTQNFLIKKKFIKYSLTKVRGHIDWKRKFCIERRRELHEGLSLSKSLFYFFYQSIFLLWFRSRAAWPDQTSTRCIKFKNRWNRFSDDWCIYENTRTIV